MNAQLVRNALQQFNVSINHGTDKLCEKAAKAKNENHRAMGALPGITQLSPKALRNEQNAGRVISGESGRGRMAHRRPE
jgi:hypothetical protein